MSISTLESAASVRMLDAINADAAQREQVEKYFADDFMYRVNHGDPHLPTEMSELRMRFTSGNTERVLRRQILTEFLANRLENGLESQGEPTVESAVLLLLQAAKGRDIREDAKILFGYMANAYGEEKANEVL